MIKFLNLKNYDKLLILFATLCVRVSKRGSWQPCQNVNPYNSYNYTFYLYTPLVHLNRSGTSLIYYPGRLGVINQLINHFRGVETGGPVSVRYLQASEDRRKEGTRAPSNFWERDTGGDVSDISKWIKSKMGEGAHVPLP